MKGGKRRNINLLPLGGLGCGEGHTGADCENDDGESEDEHDHGELSHCPPPFCPGTWGGAMVSIIPTVRLVGTKVWLATRRISALLTLSRFSTWRKSSRQSP